MNLFQVCACVVLGALIARELWKFPSQATPWMPFVRLTTWCVAIAIVYNPGFASQVAQWAGIGRGADFVLYCASFTLLMCVLYLYGKQSSLEQQLTELVRVQAIQQARRGRGLSPTNDEPAT